jgi:hypothetical protein
MAQKASASRVAAYLGHHKSIARTEQFGDGQVKAWTEGGALVNGDVFRDIRDKFGFDVMAVSPSGTFYVQ